jgi:hypothetical protein
VLPLKSKRRAITTRGIAVKKLGSTHYKESFMSLKYLISLFCINVFVIGATVMITVKYLDGQKEAQIKQETASFFAMPQEG